MLFYPVVLEDKFTVTHREFLLHKCSNKCQLATTVATLAKLCSCIFLDFCSAVDLGEEKKSMTCSSGESFIGARAKKIAVLVKQVDGKILCSSLLNPIAK